MQKRDFRCDWWLESRAKCRRPGGIAVVDKWGAPYRYCWQHWPLAHYQHPQSELRLCLVRGGVR